MFHTPKKIMLHSQVFIKNISGNSMKHWEVLQNIPTKNRIAIIHGVTSLQSFYLILSITILTRYWKFHWSNMLLDVVLDWSKHEIDHVKPDPLVYDVKLLLPSLQLLLYPNTLHWLNVPVWICHCHFPYKERSRAHLKDLKEVRHMLDILLRTNNITIAYYWQHQVVYSSAIVYDNQWILCLL